MLRARYCFATSKDFSWNRFVYVAFVSPARARLSIGVNMNPDKKCNFDCCVCEVDRTQPPRESRLDGRSWRLNSRRSLCRCSRGPARLASNPAGDGALPAELLELRHVALSGDGEPTLAPDFAEATEAVVHVRALGGFRFSRSSSSRNGDRAGSATGAAGAEVFHHPRMKSGQNWTEALSCLDRVNRSDGPSEKSWRTFEQARRRPVVIQSLFPTIEAEGRCRMNINQYAQRGSRQLKARGAQISHVQIYSATRPMPHSDALICDWRSFRRLPGPSGR